MANPVHRGLRLRVPTLILLALGVAAGAFWGGVVAQRHQGVSTSTSGLAARIAAASRGAGGFRLGGSGGSGGLGAALQGGAGGGSATRGTITDVQGPLVYLTDSSGALIKVTIGASTTVSRTGTGAPGVLQIGDTAVVRGSAGAGGTIAATAVVATAQDVAAAAAAAAGG